MYFGVNANFFKNVSTVRVIRLKRCSVDPSSLTPKTKNLTIRFMKKKSITVTEASRNFAECVNRAHYQGTTFVLLKNGRPVARLVPDLERVCDGRGLAAALEKVDLAKAEAGAWRRDLKAARDILKAPKPKWQ
jgi:prevent-host-death family protein